MTVLKNGKLVGRKTWAQKMAENPKAKTSARNLGPVFKAKHRGRRQPATPDRVDLVGAGEAIMAARDMEAKGSVSDLIGLSHQTGKGEELLEESREAYRTVAGEDVTFSKRDYEALLWAVDQAVKLRGSLTGSDPYKLIEFDSGLAKARYALSKAEMLKEPKARPSNKKQLAF